MSSSQHMGCCRSGVCRHSNGLFLPSWSRSQAQQWNLSSQCIVETAKTKHKAMCTQCYITVDHRRRWFRLGDCGSSILFPAAPPTHDRHLGSLRRRGPAHLRALFCCGSTSKPPQPPAPSPNPSTPPGGSRRCVFPSFSCVIVQDRNQTRHTA